MHRMWIASGLFYGSTGATHFQPWSLELFKCYVWNTMYYLLIAVQDSLYCNQSLRNTYIYIYIYRIALLLIYLYCGIKLGALFTLYTYCVDDRPTITMWKQWWRLVGIHRSGCVQKEPIKSNQWFHAMRLNIWNVMHGQSFVQQA